MVNAGRNLIYIHCRCLTQMSLDTDSHIPPIIVQNLQKDFRFFHAILTTHFRVVKIFLFSFISFYIHLSIDTYQDIKRDVFLSTIFDISYIQNLYLILV